jgi:putative phosphoesterase
MRILVVSDTHAASLDEVPLRIREIIPATELIIHAGDFTEFQLWQELKQLKPVKAVHGNMDCSQLKDILPASEIVQIEGHKIGIVHGWGSSWGIEGRVKKLFSPGTVNIIVYGHSHQSQNRIEDNILLFNPGKASRSFGVLTIEAGKEARGEIMSSW